MSDKFLKFTQEYRTKKENKPPADRVEVWAYERDLSKGAHASSQSAAMQEAQSGLSSVKRCAVCRLYDGACPDCQG